MVVVVVVVVVVVPDTGVPVSKVPTMACIDGLQLLYMYKPHFPRPTYYLLPTRAGGPLGIFFCAIPFYIREASVSRESGSNSNTLPGC